MNVFIPQTYSQWHHCITVECGLALTPAFIAQRLRSLQDTGDYKTQQFVQLYGEQYLQRVIGWFQQTGASLDEGGAP